MESKRPYDDPDHITFIDRLYFGCIKRKVVDVINGIACEIEYSNDRGVIGYWAYGFYDPEGIYPLVTRSKNETF